MCVVERGLSVQRARDLRSEDEEAEVLWVPDEARRLRVFALGAVWLCGAAASLLALESWASKAKISLVPLDFMTTAPTRRARAKSAVSREPLKNTTLGTRELAISSRARSTPLPSGRSRSRIAKSKR